MDVFLGGITSEILGLIKSANQRTAKISKVLRTQISVFFGGGCFVRALTYATERMSPALFESI